jgi:hypothetical protein
MVPKVRNLGFILNKNLKPVDLYKAVCKRIYSILSSVKPHARYTLFGVRKKLVISDTMFHIYYGNVVFSTVGPASQRRLQVAFNSCLRYVESMFLILCLLLSVFRWWLIWRFTFCILGTRVIFLRCFISFLQHVLGMTPHRSLAMGPSFIVGACGLWNSLPYWIKNKRALGRFVGLARTHFTCLLLFAGLDFFSSGIRCTLTPQTHRSKTQIFDLDVRTTENLLYLPCLLKLTLHWTK